MTAYHFKIIKEDAWAISKVVPFMNAFLLCTWSDVQNLTA